MSSKESKKENIWTTILGEAQSRRKFNNKQVVLLGAKNAGKRTLIDSLHATSATTYPKVKHNETHPGLLRVAGSASALDYVYLNVKNLDEPEEDTLARLGVYIMDDDSQKDLLQLVVRQNTVQDTTIVIVLDLQEPWVFMEQLEKWIDVVSKQLQSLSLSLNTLDEMRARVEKRVREYKEPIDESKQQQQQQQSAKGSDTMHIMSAEEEEEIRRVKSQLPLPEGVLKSNLGIPIVVVANKSDLLGDSGDYHLNQAILLSLRRFCLTYGASLVFTSCKQKENLDVLYEYLLHISYDFKLKQKHEANNIDSIFIPSGLDNLNLIKQSNPQQFDESKSYDEIVKKPQVKATKKEEEGCEDEQEFLKSLLEKGAGGGSSSSSNNLDVAAQLTAKFPSSAANGSASISSSSSGGSSSLIRSQMGVSSSLQTTSGQASTSTVKSNTKVADFYKDLLNRPDSKTMRMNAEKDLLQRMGSTVTNSSNLFRNEEIDQVKDIINKK